jgi:hypothetical protein
MRVLVTFLIAVAIVGVGFGLKALLTPVSAVDGDAGAGAIASKSMSPHDIHVNYVGMKELPIHDIKDAN